MGTGQLAQESVFQRIAGGRTDLVFEYVSSGESATSSEKGMSLIQWCAVHADVSAVRFLLAQGASLDELGANRGLVNAAFSGHWQLCEFLIEGGADVNEGNAQTGETPLHFALSKAPSPSRERVIEILLAKGADPNRPARPSVETEAFMRDCRTKAETPLHRAAAFGSEASIQALLDAGAARDAKDMHGDSPLGWASWYLRPRAILRQLTYGHHTVRPDRGA
jgi:ankyrin repeat protein